MDSQNTFDMTEEELIEGFTAAVRQVNKRTREAGMWTSHVEDGKVIRVYPDGRREVVREI